MNCTHFYKNLFDYLDDALSATERGEMDTHLARCAACRKVVADEKAVAGQLKDAFESSTSALTLNQRVTAEVKAALSAQSPISITSIKRSLINSWPRLALGMAAALIVVCSVWYVNRPHDEEPITTTQSELGLPEQPEKAEPVGQAAKVTQGKEVVEYPAISPALRGIVRFGGQKYGAGARVWVEPVQDNALLSDEPPPEPPKPVAGTLTTSDQDGAFAIPIDALPERFVVKAEVSDYLPAVSSIITRNDLPKEKIRVDIPSDGGCITGRIITDSGLLVTNITATYLVAGQSGLLQPHSKLPITIHDDGIYTSCIVPSGKCYVRLSAPGFIDAGIEANIKSWDSVVKDIFFRSYVSITGTVRDAVTKARVPGVELVCVSPANKSEGASWSHISDSDGTFWMNLANEELNFEFRHPDYAPVRKYFFWGDNRPKPTVKISKGGNVLVRAVDGLVQPLVGHKVKLMANHKWYWPYRSEFGEMFVGESDADGEILFQNVPTHLPPIVANVIDPDNGAILARSGRFTVKPATTTTVTVSSVDVKLIVRFSESVAGKSVWVDASAPRSVPGQGWYQRGDFLTTSNEWILPGAVKGTYRVFVRGAGIQNVETSVFVDGETDTLLEIDNSDSKATSGIIEGTVRDPSGALLPAWVHAWKHGTMPRINEDLLMKKGAVAYAYPDCGAFQLRQLNPDELYDIRVVMASLTSLVFYSVRPNGDPLDVIMPPVYRVTGSVVGRNGTPVAANTIWIGDPVVGQNDTSDFELFPVIPGTYTVKIQTDNHPLVERSVTVTLSDVDMGEIVIEDEGITIRGKLIDAHGQPLIDKTISINGPPQNRMGLCICCDVHTSRTDDDGAFTIRHAPANKPLTLSVQRLRRHKGPFSSDTDLGTIVLRRPPYFIISVLNSDSTPAAGLYVSRMKLDERGMFQGRLMLDSDTVRIYKTKGDFSSHRAHIADIPINDHPTNRVTITLPEGF